MSILTALHGRVSTREPLSIESGELEAIEILAAFRILTALKDAGERPERGLANGRS